MNHQRPCTLVHPPQTYFFPKIWVLCDDRTFNSDIRGPQTCSHTACTHTLGRLLRCQGWLPRKDVWEASLGGNCNLPGLVRGEACPRAPGGLTWPLGGLHSLRSFQLQFCSCCVHAHTLTDTICPKPWARELPFLFLENVCSSSRPLSFSCSPAGWGGDSLSQSWAAPLRFICSAGSCGRGENRARELK